MTGSVNGSYLAQTLTNRLGYGVTSGEPYYTPNCTSTDQCVFPYATIPQRAFSLPATRLLQYIPTPNIGTDLFSSGAEKERLNDNKGAMRVDLNTEKRGMLALYYFADGYALNNPLPSGFGGATVPGFSALSNGLTQLIALSHTMSFGPTAVNEARGKHRASTTAVCSVFSTESPKRPALKRQDLARLALASTAN